MGHIFVFLKLHCLAIHAVSDCTVAILFCILHFVLLLQNVLKIIKLFFFPLWFLYIYMNHFVICLSLCIHTYIYQEESSTHTHFVFNLYLYIDCMYVELNVCLIM